MKLLGWQVPFTKGWQSMVTDISPLLPPRSAGVVGLVREPFAGAWQRNMERDDRPSLLANSAVFACISRISDDISKLRVRLVIRNNGIWEEVQRQSPFWQVLRRPNNYQTRIQFMSAWLTSKLVFGNAYILKVRDARGIVVQLHVIDPRKVTPLITEDGDVYYQINGHDLAKIGPAGITVPASEVIHDRYKTLFHPLIGVSPLFAAAMAATQGNKIQNNSAVFFQNMSRPSGTLTAPAQISDDTAKRIKEHWEANYAGVNAGRIAVLGDGLKYEPMTINATDAELTAQLRWTAEDIARAFGVPAYKIGAGQMPTNNNVAALNQQYYDDCLQILIESIEELLDQAFGLNTSNADGELGTDFDLDGLLRMDQLSMYDALGKGVGGGWLSPNEARAKVNLPAVKGGDTPYLQQQNFALSALARRDAQADPFGTPTPAPAPAPKPDPSTEPDDTAKALYAELIKRFESNHVT